MDLHQIIRESVDNVIWDSIISEAIENSIAINEGTGKKKIRGWKRRGKYLNEADGKKSADDSTQAGNTAQADNVDNTAQAGNTAQADETTQNQQQQTVDFKPFAQRLSSIVGNGIDPSPVQNNQQAVQHINLLNNFVRCVITAINNNNIDIANGGAGGGYYDSGYYNPYQRTRADIYMDASQKLANQAGKLMDAPENTLNQWGLKLDTPFKGVGQAFANGHNQMMGTAQSLSDRKKQYDAQVAAKTGKGGDLVYLMQSVNTGCYPALQTEYNGMANVFGAIPQVQQCYQELHNLNDTLARYLNTNKQQTNKPQTTPKNTAQPEAGTEPETAVVEPEDKIGEKNIERTSQKLKEHNFTCNEISKNASINEYVTDCAYQVSYLIGHVTQALDNGIYYSKDADNGLNSLTQLLSLDGVDNHSFPTLDAVNKIYDGEYRSFKNSPEQYKKELTALAKIKKAIDALTKLQQTLKSNGIVENNASSGEEKEDNGGSKLEPYFGENNDIESTPGIDNKASKEQLRETYLPALNELLRTCNNLEKKKYFLDNKTKDFVYHVKLLIESTVESLTFGVFTVQDSRDFESKSGDVIDPLTKVLSLDDYDRLDKFDKYYSDDVRYWAHCCNKKPSRFRDAGIMLSLCKILRTVFQLQTQMINNDIVDYNNYSYPGLDDNP